MKRQCLFLCLFFYLSSIFFLSVECLAQTWAPGDVPDWNQPLWHGVNGPNVGPAIGPWTAWCVPTAAANLIGHWEDVLGEPGLSDGAAYPGSGLNWPNWPAYQDYQANGQTNGANQRGALSPASADDIGWYMDTNDNGDPALANSPHTGTYLRDVSEGPFALNKFFVDRKKPSFAAWTHGLTYSDSQTFVLPSTAAGFSEVMQEIDAGRTIILHFQHWNIVNMGVSVPPVLAPNESRHGYTYYTFGLPVNLSGPELGESWEGSEGETLGHAVTAVGYIPLGADTNGFEANAWVIVHDNWSQTPRNVAVPYDTGEWVANTVVQKEDVDIPELCCKWVQEPDCERGMDLQSWGLRDDQIWIPQFKIADDWLCDGRPITAITWWGSYIGWEEDIPQGPVPPPMNRPSGFRLTWYTDIPAGMEAEYSMPGHELTNVYVSLATYQQTNLPPGTASEVYQCTSELDFIGPDVVEHEYRYYVELEEPWLEKEDNVYWLSVEAYYTGAEMPTNNQWGWKTTHPDNNWNDDAVSWKYDLSFWQELHYPPQVDPWAGMDIINHPYEGLSVNMAFFLHTDVCPRRAKKWAQPPDMVEGTDMWSWRREEEPGNYPLRADDFICDGRRISDIHWWGSYSNWMVNTDGSQTNQVAPPPAGQLRPLGFDLSWHKHSEVDCLPGQLITNIFVPFEYCHEMYYGTVTQYWNETFEHEYQYYVDLLDTDAADGPWNEVKGEHYWLNIQAVFTNSFFPEPGTNSHGGWGWKITPEIQECPSVVSLDNGMTWMQDGLPLPHPDAGMPFDLAFELTTDEVGTNQWYDRSVITDVWISSGDWLGLESVGDLGSGAQVLQGTTNLIYTNWVDIMTNSLPLPSPYVNRWQWSNNVPDENCYFLRILQR